MVFAMRLKPNIAEQDHLVITLYLLKRPGKYFLGVNFVTGEPFTKRFGYAFGRIKKSFTRRVVASPTQ
jgi:hypothetical protein